MLRWLGELARDMFIGAVTLAAIWLPLLWLATLAHEAPIGLGRYAVFGVLLLVGWVATDFVSEGR